MHETVALPEPVRLVGVMEPQNRPLGMMSVRLTVPAKPLSGAIVIVELGDEPTLAAGGDEALIVKF